MKEIGLTQGKVTVVDDGDFEELSKHKWYAAQRQDNWYAVRSAPKDASGKRSVIYMHRVIMGAQPGQQVDHEDRNGLHNWRANLRLCSCTQNQANRKKQTGGSSIYKGVGWFRRDDKWRARIMVLGRDIHLGYFNDETEAAIAYNKAAIEHFGEFARPNVVEGEP